MKASSKKVPHRQLVLGLFFLIVNLMAGSLIAVQETQHIQQVLARRGEQAQEKLGGVMADYTHSFQLFAQLLQQTLDAHPDPDVIWDELKTLDRKLAAIEGDTFDGVYMVYQDRYLYSWDTPYSQYESTGYRPQDRPWYQDAVQGQGAIVFTPPYMSYANHYILSTISQLQPDQETVFAYDIKMGNIQQLVRELGSYDQEQLLVYDANGTIIGSTEEAYLGSTLTADAAAAQTALQQAQAAMEALEEGTEAWQKAKEQAEAAEAFAQFRRQGEHGLQTLLDQPRKASLIKLGSRQVYGYLSPGEDYQILILVPLGSLLGATAQVWLLPFLVLELILVYGLSRVRKEWNTRELQQAYVELGQTQKRLEIALKAAQKAAAIDDLTGTMNFKSFRQNVTEQIQNMQETDAGILIMLDGDHFKTINDNYGHQVGDEVIKLAAQMIIGRIRTVDLASRLHGDEFAIFIANTQDYTVAQKIVGDINASLVSESARRHMPNITLSAGAVIVRRGSNYAQLAKVADAALYEAKSSHDGGFAHA